MKSIPLLNASDIEVKVKQVRNNGVIALLYKTARIDMAILDDTFGAENWACDYKEIKGNLYCGIGIRYPETDEFIWKWDCGIESRTDDDGNQKKGEASDAFKRAATKCGIGRELYTAPFIYIKADTIKEGNRYRLQDRYASYSVKEIAYTDTRRISLLTIIDRHGETVFTWNGAKPSYTPENSQKYKCERCGQPFEAQQYKGKTLTPKETYEMAIKVRGAPFCKHCWEEIDHETKA